MSKADPDPAGPDRSSGGEGSYPGARDFAASDEMTGREDGTISWGELLVEAREALAARGNPDAGGDARRIIEEVSGSSPSAFLLGLDELVTEGGMSRYEKMLSRRLTGEPLQYVLGSWAFRTLDLMVDRRVLIPRPETEAVVEMALAELDLIGGTERETLVVDLGTGSGAIGLSIAAERVRSRVWLTDSSSDALDVARANIAGLGRSGARVSSALGSWFEALPDDLRGTVDLIISNPPYVATAIELPGEVTDWEPGSALWSGEDGTDDLRKILAGAGEWLRVDGVLVCEISPEQTGTVLELADRHFHECRIGVDLTGRDRALLARRPRP